jgi:hypothetical protein
MGRVDEGSVRLRSNVVLDGEAWHLVPGDALYQYAPDRLKPPNRPTQRQRDEHMYYVPCSRCGRVITEIQLQGCNECPHGPSRDAQNAAIARHDEAQRKVKALKAAMEHEPELRDHLPAEAERSGHEQEADHRLLGIPVIGDLPTGRFDGRPQGSRPRGGLRAALGRLQALAVRFRRWF